MSKKDDPLDLYVIYDHPKDHPNNFVVRRWKLAADGTLTAENDCFLAGTIDDARSFVPRGLVHIPRYPQDDPVITEVWM